MRKMPKGLALVGGILCILSILISVLGIVTTVITYSTHGNTEAIGPFLTANIPGILIFILLAVVLFRGKVDVFPGVVFILAGVYALVNSVSGIVTLNVYKNMGVSLLSPILASVAKLLRGVVFILTAVHCFNKKAGKTPLYGIGFIVVGLVGAAQAVASQLMFTDFNPALLPGLIGAAIGSILDIVPMVLAGFGVGNAKSTASGNPNDPYGVYAMYGMPPSGGAPAYQPQAPQYQPQAPQYQPQAPEFKVPEPASEETMLLTPEDQDPEPPAAPYQPPQQPQYQAPQYPQYQQPQYQAPQYPQYQQPQYQAPQYPQYQQPQYQAPQYPQYQQPQYQAPQYPQYQQPQYQAPQQPEQPHQ